MNQLFFGDNLRVLRDHIADDSVDLIYLDPPFNSKRDYSVLFKTPKGHESDAQITAFEDTWHWGKQAELEFDDLVKQPNSDVTEMMESLRKYLGENDMMAYLTMMANRLLQLHRVLKPTGSLYLHCDPTASHYLKVVMDGIFGVQNYRNEIVWRRKGGSALAGMRVYSTATDIILFYTKSDDYTFNTVFMPPDPEYVEQNFTRVDENGRQYQATVMRSPNPRPNLMYDYKGYKTPPNGWAVGREKMEEMDRKGMLYFPKDKSKQIYKKLYLDEYPGQPANNLWTDIPTLKGNNAEILGYPTQKPVALLERIIKASSNEGDVVLDPFCGCGTAVHAAQKLKREWVGIDITHLAIALIESRLKEAFPKEENFFTVEGVPTNYHEAKALAQRDKYQFQWWACTLVKARPYQGKKKGSDGGIDGLIFFTDDPTGSKKIVVSVKGGESVGVDMVKNLIATVKQENAAIGLFITLTEPTRPMTTAAAKEGFYESKYINERYPKIQILTVEGLLSGRERAEHPDLSLGRLTFQKAEPQQPDIDQTKLF